MRGATGFGLGVKLKQVLCQLRLGGDGASGPGLVQASYACTSVKFSSHPLAEEGVDSPFAYELRSAAAHVRSNVTLMGDRCSCSISDGWWALRFATPETDGATMRSEPRQRAPTHAAKSQRSKLNVLSAWQIVSCASTCAAGRVVWPLTISPCPCSRSSRCMRQRRVFSAACDAAPFHEGRHGAPSIDGGVHG